MSLRQLSQKLQHGEVSATSLAEASLKKARAGKAVFIQLNDQLLEQAAQIDKARASGQTHSPLAGIPISLKDLFNQRGQKTLAGSKVLADIAATEQQDAEVVKPLREAGMLFVGRTNMSEFAFSGMGINAHYGTPLSIWDRAQQRIPGGSSSGSAVSVADGTVVATLGSDTAGSCRIPAAFNGIVGVKPSYGRLSLRGIYPLSPSSDAPGPLAVDLDSCFILDQLMRGDLEPAGDLPKLTPAGSIRLLLPESVVLEELDDEVASAFTEAVRRLQDSGIEIIRKPAPVLEQCIDMFFNRAVVFYEAYQHHRELLALHGDAYDPFVRQRLLRGEKTTAEQHHERLLEKAALVDSLNRLLRESAADALIYPTTPNLPPLLSEASDAEKATAINLRCLRNTSTVNYFDGCAISLPCRFHSTAPVGFMLSAANGDDEHLYRVAAAIEPLLASQ